MGNTLLTSGYALLGGLLAVMVITAVLFIVITVIALKPVKLNRYNEMQAVKQRLSEREAELLTEYQKKRGNKKASAEILAKLHELVSAEKLLDELTEDEAADAQKHAKHKEQTK